MLGSDQLNVVFLILSLIASVLQAQLVVLASQIAWSESCEEALQAISSSSNQKDLGPMMKVLRVVEATLNILADSVLQEQPPVRRRKLEHLVSKWFHLVKRS